MIISRGKGKKRQGFIICACGAEELHPTSGSDRWYACWCENPDRCVACGACEMCFGKGIRAVATRYLKPKLTEGTAENLALTV